MKRRFVLLLFILVGLFSPMQRALSQKIDFKGSYTQSQIPFDFIQNLVIIQMSVDDSGPLNFILDSGVGPLIITDSAIVDSLQTDDVFMYRIRGRGIGPEIEAYLIHDIKVSIGRHASGHLSAVLLKNEPFRLSFFLGIPIHGIIGSDFFNSFKVHLSYTKKKISFYRFDTPMKMRGNRLPIQIIGGKPYANFEILKEDGEVDTLLLLIDTGAGHAVSLDLTEDQMDLKPKATIPANLGIGLSGPIDGYIGRLRRIDFYGFSMNGVIAAFPQYEDLELRNLMTIQKGSIGGELLKRFNILFDYSKKELYFKKNRFYKAPFEYDMAGIEIYAVKDKNRNRFFVNRVEKNSPAELQGFAVDDELLFINFKDVNQYSLNELYGLFKKESKNGLIIQLRRGNEVIFKFLNLRRRI